MNKKVIVTAAELEAHFAFASKLNEANIEDIVVSKGGFDLYVTGNDRVKFKFTGLNNVDYAALVLAAGGSPLWEAKCLHTGYSFSKHGRCCPHCGEFLTDFRD